MPPRPATSTTFALLSRLQAEHERPACGELVGLALLRFECKLDGFSGSIPNVGSTPTGLVGSFRR